MLRTVTRNANHACECANCGRLLLNPGYHKRSVFCCGKYRQWYDEQDDIITLDDGRDERGRFHHAPRTVSRERVVHYAGGR